jgi:hypothetical protein
MANNMRSRLLLGGLLAMALAAPVVAQPPATIVLKSGEQRPALNLGLFDGNTLIVRTSFEQEPRFPIDQVAYIDFGGGGGDARGRLRGSQHALMLRDGRMMQGQVTRIAHAVDADQKSPYIISIKMSNGEERQVAGNEVARVYFGETVSASGPRANGTFRPDIPVASARQDDARVIDVSARQLWTATGLAVRRGDRLSLRSSGRIRLSTTGLTASPDGSGQFDPRAPLPQTFSGALIGRVGNGRPFGIGGQTELEMPDSGPFMLGVNDSVLTDNDGAFRVEIRRIP